MQKSYPVLKTLVPTALLLVLGLQACKKDKKTDPPPPPPSPPALNLTKEQLNELTTSMVLDMRLSLDTYFDVTGITGRENYRFSPTEVRYTTDLLGSGSVTLSNINFILPLPGRPDSASVVPAPAALDSVARFLDEAKAVLTGSALPPLPTGFQDYSDAPGFIKINRALAARVADYRQQWMAALTALNESFFNLSGDLNAGPKHAFATFQGDILNPCFIAKNEIGDVRLAHPSFATGIISGDDRIGKTSLRTSAKSQDGLSSNRDIWIYPVNVTSIPIIRNEELILIYAEAKIQNNQVPDGIVALNRIRTGHNLSSYTGGITQASLINEMLNQRRYSLAFEGHYWVDMRRYNWLNTLPIDRPNDDVRDKFPIPGVN